MKVAVKDANVLIDLVEGDLLGLWFRLGIETYVPDLCSTRSSIPTTGAWFWRWSRLETSGSGHSVRHS